MTLIVETGAIVPGANSYASVAEADARHAMSTSADAWDAFDLPVKEQRLVTATRRLDTLFDWIGQPWHPDQPLGFPRRSRLGVGMPVSGIPVRLKQATIDLALWLPEEVANSATASAGGDVVQEVTLGPIGIKLAAPSASTTTTTTAVSQLVPSEVLLLLRGLGQYLGGGGGSVGRLVR